MTLSLSDTECSVFSATGLRIRLPLQYWPCSATAMSVSMASIARDDHFSPGPLRRRATLTSPVPAPDMSSHRSRLIWTAPLCGLVATLSCMKATASAEGAPLIAVAPTPPKLIVFITVDQLRGDMLMRFSGDLQYGFARLTRGAWFTNAFQDHA